MWGRQETGVVIATTSESLDILLENAHFRSVCRNSGAVRSPGHNLTEGLDNGEEG
eukprot:m.233705 g.233705  ORF g.233705 m.233705 type:complete len:55 (+) comp40096_c0_seq3:1494-1658(+)